MIDLYPEDELSFADALAMAAVESAGFPVCEENLEIAWAVIAEGLAWRKPYPPTKESINVSKCRRFRDGRRFHICRLSLFGVVSLKDVVVPVLRPDGGDILPSPFSLGAWMTARENLTPMEIEKV